jgi:hypothetical protein
MRLFLQPFRDILNGLERCLVPGVSGLIATFAGLLATWWVYVPVHELLHAFGCELGGGRVWRLEISPLYGGALLERWLSFVEAGGEYAGRLSGFDTVDSTAVHLLTTGLPFVLTVFPGVWLLRWGARRGSGVAFGVGLVLATAPILSLTGDAYEIGSLIATQIAPWSSEAARAALIGDDVFVVAPALRGGGALLWAGFAVAAALAVVWAFLTYAAGAAVASQLGQPAIERPPRRPARDSAPVRPERGGAGKPAQGPAPSGAGRIDS